jgi:putative nucleotidyltransferase with HDIG domain
MPGIVEAAQSRARPYVLAVLCAGSAVLVVSVAQLATQAPSARFWILVALTLMSGSAVLKIPTTSVNFSISDVFTLTSAVVFGPAAATVAVALESLLMSARVVRSGLTLERVLFNAVAPPLAMWVSARTFFMVSGLQPLSTHGFGPEVVGPWLLLFAAQYFFLNTFAVAVAIALHERGNAFAIWRAHFLPLWMTFVGGAVGAVFVVFSLKLGTYGIVALSFPLLLAFILHYGYRHATGRITEQLNHLAEVNRLHLSTIEALAHAIDAKDGVTHDHIRRVQRVAVKVATRIGVEDELQLRAIETAALLHDVGKLAIPERILNKPGGLTPAEFDRMKMHAQVGADILSEVDFPFPVVPIVRHHHENWDGTGYPDAVRGADIPLGARILAVVDCFDALTSDRPYRRAMSMDQALALIEKRRGTMYDPTVVDAFREMCAAGEVVAAEQADGLVSDPRALQATAPLKSAPEARHEIRLAMRLGAALRLGSATDCPWRALATALCTLSEVDTVAVFVVDDSSDRIVPLHVTGRHARAVAHLAIPIGERVSGWAAGMDQPMVNADAVLDLFDVEAGALCSAAAVPCRGKDVRVVVTLYSTEAAAFGPHHERLIEGAVSFLESRTTFDSDRPAVAKPPRAAGTANLHVLH